MPSPKQTFLSNIRPAELLLQVFSLFDTNDQFMTQGQMIEALRPIVRANQSEDLLVVYNELFLGLIREEAPNEFVAQKISEYSEYQETLEVA